MSYREKLDIVFNRYIKILHLLILLPFNMLIFHHTHSSLHLKNGWGGDLCECEKEVCGII